MNIGKAFHENWVETVAVILLMLGFAMAISINNIAYIYIIIFLAGLIAGRFCFLRIGKRPLFPIVLIIVGFLLGYTLGAFSANRKIIALLFVIGWIVSHIFHKKGYC